jgi:hypothetical protein
MWHLRPSRPVRGNQHDRGSSTRASRPRLAPAPIFHSHNNVRLNSATGYITPKDMLAGRQQEIHAERDRKLEEARKQRQIRRQQAA